MIGELPWSVVARGAGRRHRADPAARGPPRRRGPTLRVNIDPKHDAAVEPLAATLRRCDAVDRVCVGAFSDERLARVRAAAARRLHVARPDRLARSSAWRPPARSVGELEAPCAQLPPYLRRHRGRHRGGRRPRRTGAACRCTCGRSTTPAEMARLLDLGVDGIMTDRPAVLKDVLDSRPVGPVGSSEAPAHPARLPRPGPAAVPRPRRRRAGRRRPHDLRRVRRPLRRPGPPARRRGRRAARRPGGLPRRQHPPAARGLLRRAARRRRAAAAQHPQLGAPSSPSASPTAGAAALVPRPDAPRPRLRRTDVRAATTGASRRPTGRASAGRRGRRRPSSSTRRARPGCRRAPLLSHRALYLHAVHNALTNGITGNDVLLHTIPLFHVNGWGTRPLPHRPRRHPRHAPPLRRRRGAAPRRAGSA